MLVQEWHDHDCHLDLVYGSWSCTSYLRLLPRLSCLDKLIIPKHYSSQTFRDIDPKPSRGDRPGTRCQVLPVVRCDQASIVPWSLHMNLN